MNLFKRKIIAVIVPTFIKCYKLSTIQICLEANFSEMPEILANISSYFDKHQWAQPAIFSVIGVICSGIWLILKKFFTQNENDKAVNQKQKSGHNSVNIQIGNYNRENK